MTTRYFAIAGLIALSAILPAAGQSPSDLLQKGLHLQEAAGDVDGAISVFRQVVTSASATNKPVAAQAQYQLVLCMLQKGDRTAAQKELSLLEANFSNMPDLVERARHLVPGTASAIANPWPDN